MKTYPLYLNNEWVTTEATYSVSNPATDEVFASIATVGRDRVARALKDAHSAFLSWRQQTGKARGEFLHKIAAEVERYTVAKDDLQRRIDMINQLKQNQKGPSGAMKVLSGVDPFLIDSVAIDDKTITINSHAEIKTDAEVVERRSTAGRYMLKVKI